MVASDHSDLLNERAHESYTSTRRVFRIIDRVSRDGEHLTVKGLAGELGISLSTCYHLIHVLVQEGYVEKRPHHAGYRLGPMIAVLYDRSTRHGRAVVIQPILHELARRAGRTAYYAVLSGDDVLVTNVDSPPGSPSVGVPQGFRGPSHALALGKVLIAAGGIPAIVDYVQDHRLEAFTPRTITDPARLEENLKAVHARGYATDLEEFAKNLYCVAVPVEGAKGDGPAAVGLATTADSGTEELRQLVQLAHRAARQMSAALRGLAPMPA